MDHTPDIVLLGIGTAVPAWRLDQADTALRVAEALRDDPGAARWARRIFRQQGIEARYTCEPNLLEEAGACRYFPRSREAAPATAERMGVYRREALPLARLAAERALADSGTPPGAVTHLITTSCTGQYLPGLDAELIRALGLPASVNRLPLTFVGCAAGLKAIGLARQFAAASPNGDVRVLVVCVELCTLHFQPSGAREDLFAASLFGDGASACVVGAPADGRTAVFRLGQPRSVLLPGGEADMTWNIGPYGFELMLSANVPRLIRTHLPAEIRPFMAGGTAPGLWAIHPGGRGIIDAVEETCGLSAEQTRPSREVLRQYGNMSSAAILFVMQELRRELQRRPAWTGPLDGIAVAFGPGLTAELLPFGFAHAPVPGESGQVAVHA
ncbi:MAG: type III polyketide synthase [Paenibacillaceae bacterium]|nr:MAG: type III polyketide synthase [Paenibacillaceae bacterium]